MLTQSYEEPLIQLWIDTLSWGARHFENVWNQHACGVRHFDWKCVKSTSCRVAAHTFRQFCLSFTAHKIHTKSGVNHLLYFGHIEYQQNTVAKWAEQLACVKRERHLCSKVGNFKPAQWFRQFAKRLLWWRHTSTNGWGVLAWGLWV